MKEFEYEVALSFAGEDRPYVDKVANYLKRNDVSVFYDSFEDLWGEDLFQHLSDVYQNKARFIIIFISQHYAKKPWAKHELKSAQAGTFLSDRTRILPVIFDETEIPGVLRTIGYEDARVISPEDLCRKVLKKLDKIDDKSELNNNDSDDNEIEIVQVKRKITDLEKHEFLQKSFIFLKDYFKKGLTKLEKSNSNVKTQFEEITSQKFVAKIFVDGDLNSMCKIWMSSGSSFGGDIGYVESTNGLDVSNDNTYNDSAYLKEDGKDIFFEISAMSFGMIDSSINTQKASSKDLSIYLWKRFLKNIN